MPRQREIREKALLSLFATDSKEDSLQEGDLCTLCYEPELERITKLSVKTLKHQLQSLPKWQKELTTVTPPALPILRSYELKKEAKDLSNANKAIKEFSELYSKVNKTEELDQLFSKAKTLSNSLAGLHKELEAANLTDPLANRALKAVSEIKTLLHRANRIATPLEHQEVSGISALVKAAEELHKLQTEAVKYHAGISENLETIDDKIKDLLENFSKEQIGKVERNILRLGVYEITTLALPKAVVINEALELAKKYATDEAVPLINGVLDKLEA